MGLQRSGALCQAARLTSTAVDDTMTTAQRVAVTGLTIAVLAAHAPARAQTAAQERACAALAASSAGPEDLTITEARFYENRAIAARAGAEMTLPSANMMKKEGDMDQKQILHGSYTPKK